MKFLFAVIHSEAVSRVDNPDDSVGLFKVIPPVRTQRALSADIPYSSVKRRFQFTPITTHRYSEYNWEGC